MRHLQLVPVPVCLLETLCLVATAAVSCHLLYTIATPIFFAVVVALVLSASLAAAAAATCSPKLPPLLACSIGVAMSHLVVLVEGLQ